MFSFNFCTAISRIEERMTGDKIKQMSSAEHTQGNFLMCTNNSCNWFKQGGKGCGIIKCCGPPEPVGLNGKNSLPVSLAAASVEIGRALADHGKRIFRSHGTCMYPNIRPGDVLHIRSQKIEDVVVGDIAVCRHNGKLFGHRVFRTGRDPSGVYVVTRPDRTKVGTDGPTYGNDLLGVVTKIERRGRRISPSPHQHSPLALVWLRACFAFHQVRPKIRVRIAAMMRTVQRTPVYRRLGRLWWMKVRDRLQYEVRIHFGGPGRTYGLYQTLPADEFNVGATQRLGRPGACWTLTLKHNAKSPPLAFADFIHMPDDCPNAGWWLNRLHVRVRCRGVGLEDDLHRRGQEIFARSGFELRGNFCTFNEA